MDYSEIISLDYLLMLLVLLVVIVVIIILNTKLNIIVYSNINNSDISINVNIKYMFSLIDIDKQIYPIKSKKKKVNYKVNKNKKKKQKKGNNKYISLASVDIRKLYRLIRKIKVYEIYSKIDFGTEYIQLTSFIYVLINCIYGFLANFINPDKMYLGVNPNYTKNYVLAKFKIHVEPTIKELLIISIELLKVFIKSRRKAKGGKYNEGNRINSEFNGNNA